VRHVPYPYSDLGRQNYNRALAREQAPRVRAVIDKDPRFKEVLAGEYTDQGGSVILIGDVETTEDLCRLMRAVADLQLPVPLAWHVSVRAEGKRTHRI
jgi:hypothetical protein